MKLLLLLTFIITSATIVKAQVVKKGDILLGATMGYGNNSSRSNINAVSSNTNISPRIGVGIGKNSILGLRAGIGFYKGKNDDNSYKTTSNSIGVDLFWKKLLPINNQVGWYVDASGGVGFNKQNYNQPTNPGQKSRSTSYIVNAAPGFYYQPIKKLLLSVDFGGVQYTNSHSKTEYSGGGSTTKTRSSEFQLSLLNSFSFSVDFLLGKNS